MLNYCGIVATILKMETGRIFSMSGINSGHHNLPRYEISLKSNNVEFVRYCGGHFENGDRQNFSMSGINSGHHNLPTYEMSSKSDNVEFERYCGDRQKFFNVGNQFGTSLSTQISNFDDIRQCLIFAAILQMATAGNFSISGINSRHHNLPTYEMSLKSDNVEFVQYCGGHFENGDRQKFFNVRKNSGHHIYPHMKCC